MDQVRYIQQRAARCDPRTGRFRELVLFSTESGDAWLLDTVDHFANRVAQDRVARPVHIVETDTRFAIEWQGKYQIDGDVFVYADNATGRLVSIMGYPDEVFEELA